MQAPRIVGKLGCLPFVHTPATKRMMAAAVPHLDALGPAPKHCFPWHDAVENATTGDWFMQGNDNEGDCVPADDAHQIMLWTANNGSIIVPTTAETIAYYHAVNGTTDDNGTEPGANADYLMKNGFIVGGKVHKIDAYMPIDPTNVDHYKWAMNFFGGVKFCVNLPAIAQQQFTLEQPWDVVANDGGDEGGHDILGTYYYTDDTGNVIYLDCSWARLQKATQPWKDKYLNMVIAVLSKDFINKDGVDAAGLKYDALVADLKAVA